MAGGSCGRGSLRSDATGALSVFGAPGQRWERLGARSRGCGRGTLASTVARSQARRGGAEADPILGIPHPCTLVAAGIRGLYERSGWRWFWGSAQPPVGGGGAPRGRSSKDPHPQRTHTLVGRPARLTQALPLFAGTRRARPRTYVHAYIYPYIRAHRHTSRTPAPTGARSLAQNPLQRLHVQAARTHNPWPYRATDHNRV